MVAAKILLQDIWKAVLDWDEEPQKPLRSRLATISQGCTRAGQRANTPVDRDPNKKRNSIYSQMLPRINMPQRYT